MFENYTQRELSRLHKLQTHSSGKVYLAEGMDSKVQLYESMSFLKKSTYISSQQIIIKQDPSYQEPNHHYT